MAAYFVILTLLMTLSMLALWFPKYQKVAAYISTIFLILFAGLRFETGYDWQGYESFYREIFGLKGIMCTGIPKLLLVVEPLFFSLNILFKSFTAKIVYLNFFIAFFNLALIHWVVSKISRSVPQMWMLYFGLAFLIAQMTTIRQGMASSLILLSLYFVSEQQIKKALFTLAISMGFHISSIIFLPVLILRKHFPTKNIIFSIVFFGVICAVSGVQIQNYIFKFASTIPGLWMAAKFSSYFNSNHAISMGALAVVFYHFVILAILILKTTDGEKKSSIVIVTTWVTLLSIISHLYFPGLPSIWNRVMFVALPLQMATLYNLEFMKISSRQFLTLSFIGIFVVSSASLFYSLKKESAEPFKPYYSVLSDVSHRIPDWRMKNFEDVVASNEKINKGQLTAGPRRELFEPLLTPIFDIYCR
jgi:hypothetical protein